MAQFTFDENAIDMQISNMKNTMDIIRESAAKLFNFWHLEMEEAISDDVRQDWDEEFRKIYKYCSTDLTALVENLMKTLDESKNAYLLMKEEYKASSKSAQQQNYSNAAEAAERAKHPNGLY